MNAFSGREEVVPTPGRASSVSRGTADDTSDTGRETNLSCSPAATSSLRCRLANGSDAFREGSWPTSGPAPAKNCAARRVATNPVQCLNEVRPLAQPCRWHSMMLLLTVPFARRRGSHRRLLRLRKVSIRHILGNHSLGIEKGAVQRNRRSHDFRETGGLPIEHRQNDLLEFVVERRGFVGKFFRLITLCADRPPRGAFRVSLDPPTVQNAQTRNSIQRRFHAARTGGFLRSLRRIQPKVRAARDELRPTHVVVRDVNKSDGILQIAGHFHYVPDQFFPRSILRMGLSAEDDLQGAKLLGQPPQAIPVREQQFRPLVRRRAPRKTDRKQLLVQLHLRLAVYLLQQNAFRGGVSLVDFHQRDSARVAEVQIVPPPLRDVPVVELAECRSRPGDRVHSIGNGADGIQRKHFLGNLSVMHGHAVDVTRKLESQIGHVQCAFRAAPRDFENPHPLGSQDLLHQRSRELVVARWYRRVRCENALRANRFEILFGRRAELGLPKPLLQKTQGKQGGMPFIHVIAGEVCVTQFAKDSHSADAEQGFLAQPVMSIIAVEMVGESSIPGRVFRQVRVEQIDRNLVPENSANRIFPRPETNLPPFDFYGSSCSVLFEQPLGMPLRIFFELIAPRVEPLTKVAPAVDQRYADHRSSEVSSGTERVPSQNTQASAVGWNPGLERDLH